MAIEQLTVSHYEAKLFEPIALYDHVLIDVDSCISGIEGIIKIAGRHGREQEITALTDAAMGGEVPLDSVFAKRLDAIDPVADDLTWLGQEYISHVTPYVREAVALLQYSGVDIMLMSGGYDEAIYPLADFLGIPRDHVYANHLQFEDGAYAGFDDANPLCKPGGKRILIERLKETGILPGRIALIGDGVPEAEAKSVVDLCIGFGGHVTRNLVFDEADVFIHDKSFAPLLPFLLGTAGMAYCLNAHPEFRSVLYTGMDLASGAMIRSRVNGESEHMQAAVASATIFERSEYLM